MGKLFKFLAVTLVTLIVAIGLFTFYLLTIFDPNDFKQEIQQWVKQQTQLELAIDGDLSLSVFPWLGVAANSVTLNKTQQEIAAVKQLQIFAKLKPLLNSELVVDGVKLDHLKLNLIVDKNGKGNWEIDSPATSKTPNKNQASLASAPLAAFSLGDVNIENAEINYRDLQQKTHYQLLDLALQIHNPELSNHFPLTADFNYLQADNKVSVPVHIDTNITLDLPNQAAQLEDLSIDLAKTRILGDVKTSRLFNKPQFTSQLEIGAFNPSQWAVLLQVPSLADMDLPIDMKLSATLDTDKDTLKLDSISVKSSLVEAHGNANISQLSLEPNTQGKLQIKFNDLKRLLAMSGNALSPQDPKALNQLAGQFKFKATGQSLNISELDLTLDQTKLTGNFVLKNYDKPDIVFNLSGDAFNLDRYLPKTAAATDQQQKNKEQPPALLLPVALLGALNIDSVLQLKKLVASGLTIENLNFKAKGHDGLINLERIKGDLYEGNFAIDGVIDARGKTPQIAINKTLNNMQAGPVLKALADIDYISGKLNLALNINTQGNDLDQIKRNLNGKANFSVTNGVLKEISLEQMVCEGIATIRQLELIPSATKNTRFKTFDGSMTINNGLVNLQALNIAVEKLKARGTGTINLPQETLDLGINTTLLGDLENKACEVHARYRDIEWPIRCAGKWDAEPSDLCSIDAKQMQKIIVTLAEKELKLKAGSKLEETLRKKLGDDFGDQLQQILKFK